jgi:hypothetical protein
MTWKTHSIKKIYEKKDIIKHIKYNDNRTENQTTLSQPYQTQSFKKLTNNLPEPENTYAIVLLLYYHDFNKYTTKRKSTGGLYFTQLHL